MQGDRPESVREPGRSGYLSAAGDAPADSGWVLTLVLAGPGRLLAVLSDGKWFFHAAEAPWPPTPDTPALPRTTAGELARVDAAGLRLQMPAALDDWPWELELGAAGIGHRVVPRYLTDLPADVPSPSKPGPLVSAARAGLSPPGLTQADLGPRRALIVAGPALAAEQRIALEHTVRAHWRDPMLLSEALTAALAQLGLTVGDCRLYGDARAQPVDTEQGWRPATVLSIDVVKSTPLLQSLGAEAYAQRLQAYHGRCREVIHLLQGSLDVPQGDDGLMAYFGFPLAVEDAAARALTAAWQLVRGMADLALQVRIGVASGQVAVSARQAFGDDVHLAARLRAAAEPGHILVAPSTRERVGPGFLLDDCGDGLVLKDYPDVKTVYRLAGLAPAAPGAGPRTSGKGRFIGRRREMELLRRAWLEACEGRLQWCTVRGEAGIGKSRLLQEFALELREQGRLCLEVCGQAQGRQSPFAAVIDALRRYWSVAPDADAASLAQQLSGRLPGGPGEIDAATLAQLLSPWQEAQLPATAGGSRSSTELLLNVLVAIIAPGPFCVLVDDAHWLDPSTVELLRRLREACAHRALLVLVGERTESARAIGMPGTTLMELPGLSADESRELVGHLGRGLSRRTRQHVIERAEGVPLYLEESLRMLEQRGGRVGDEVPATLEDLLMVRLDSLGPDRALCQLMSVLGRECSEAQLQALLALDDAFVERARSSGSLVSLLGSGLVQAQEGTPPSYRFKHALIRDAAYGSLWTDDRRRLHGLCADLIDHRAPGLWSGRPEQLAQHLELSGRLEPARRAWMAAAQLAAARSAHQETVELTQRALSLYAQVSDGPERAQGEMQLHLLTASAQIALQGYGSAEVEAAYQAAERASQRLTDTEQPLRIRLGLEACHVMRGDLARAAELAGSVVAATDWSRNARLALQARWAYSNVRFHQGDWQTALAGFEDCLAHYRPQLHRRSGVQDPAIMCLGYSSWILFELGRADESLQHIDRMLALAEELQHPFSTSIALGFAASVKRLCGDSDGAWPHAVDAVQVCERGGFLVWLAHAWMARGQLRADRGDAEGGDEDMRRGYDLWFGGGARISCATYRITWAEVLLRQGRTRAASEQLDEAWRISEQIGEHYYQSELLRLQGLCAWQAGDAARAGQTLALALAVAQRQLKPGLALRCGLSLGALEAAQGRCEAAALRVRGLLAGLTRHGRSRDLRWAHGALSQWEHGLRFAADEKTPWEPR